MPSGIFDVRVECGGKKEISTNGKNVVHDEYSDWSREVEKKFPTFAQHQSWESILNLITQNLAELWSHRY